MESICKENLYGKKIWIGDNPKLSQRVQEKAKELGFKHEFEFEDKIGIIFNKIGKTALFMYDCMTYTYDKRYFDKLKEELISKEFLGIYD